MASVVYNDVWADQSDIDPYFKGINGQFAIGQRVIRRLVSTRGTHPTDPNYGSNVRAWLGSNFSLDDINTRETAVEIEANKEEKVIEARATITTPDSDSFNIALYLITTEGDFVVEMSVDPKIKNASGESVASSTKYFKSLKITVTDEPQKVLEARSSRGRLKIHNDNDVDVYRSFGKAPTEDSIIIGLRSNEDWADPSPQGSVWLMCKTGETAEIAIEEHYN